MYTCAILKFTLIFQLINPNITIESVVVDGGGNSNEIQTMWMESDVDFSRGLDFSDRGAVFARFTHLNHIPFTYKYVNIHNFFNIHTQLHKFK